MLPETPESEDIPLQPFPIRRRPIYDMRKTYAENVAEGPFFDIHSPLSLPAPLEAAIDFLGFRIATPIGVPAGPLLNSHWVSLAAQLGFDVVTYKTIRSVACPAHPLPNIVPVLAPEQLGPENTDEILVTQEETLTEMEQLTITNSFGMPSGGLDYLSEDIVRAKNALGAEQVMIVSVVGTESEKRNFADDFVYTAAFARDLGVEIIEANFSCPNVTTGQGSLYTSPESVYSIASKLTAALGDTPCIIKLGAFSDFGLLRQVLLACARAGVQAVCGVNTLSRRVMDQQGRPALDASRITSGICGEAIRETALQFIREVARINREEKLGLVVLGTGGVVRSKQFTQFLEAGADVAMTATGMIWDPFLAQEYRMLRSVKDV